MSSGAISLEAAIRTCKVDTAWANKVESDRFLNPNNMVCPLWNGMDTSGRMVCPDSFATKSAGCNSPEDRVVVENNVTRPQYMEYINLNAGGVSGNIYGSSAPWVVQGERTRQLRNVNNLTGQFGNQFGAEVYPSCGAYPYNNAMSQESQKQREDQAEQVSKESYEYRRHSGF